MTTFISYSRADSTFVMRLAKDLKAAGIDVWVDQLDIPKGTRWDDEIEAAVERSSTFMVVLAPESMESQNVKDELSYAIDSGKHILPVIIKPCKIPLRLRRFQHVDFTDKPYKESLAEMKRLLSDTQRIPTGVGEQSKPVSAQKSVPAAFKGTKPPPVDKPAGKKQPAKIMMPAIIVVVLGIAVAAVLMATRSSGVFSPPPVTSTSALAPKPPTLTLPAPTTIPATSTAAIRGQFYTEEFDHETFDWTQVMVKGVERQVSAAPADGSLVIQLSPYQKEEPYVLFVNNDYTYTDVQVEAAVTNNGNNANAAVLACRIGENGWYAFEISNGGTYSIKAFDTSGKFTQGYKELTNGGSTAIQYGKATNVYRAICAGNDLTLMINDTPVETYTDTVFNFTEGNIGIGADSPQKLPVDLQFDSVKVGQP